MIKNKLISTMVNHRECIWKN